VSPVLERTMTRRPDDRWTMTEVGEFLERGPAASITPAPLAATDPDSTRILQATPSQPVAVPPVVVDPELAGELTQQRPPARRARSAWPWVIAAVAVLAVVAIVGAALVGNGDDSHRKGGPSAPRHSSPSGPSSSNPGQQAAAIRTFIRNYLATATSDQQASWAMLTPAFQRESGNFGQYQKFWRSISSATPHDISPDPAALTVTYGVDYVHTDGSTSTDEVTLQLVHQGSSYLIGGES
jgi:hypothetical protein